MLDQALVAFAGLGFFLAGLHMLSEVVRLLAARRVRKILVRLGKYHFSSALTGILLGAVTQSTSAATYVCIGLLNGKAISFPAAIAISSWAGVGTSVLVFMASVDLRLAALFSLSLVGLFYIASLQRHEAGRRMVELLLATGITLLGLAMVKDAAHVLEGNSWVQEFFVFSSESWVYGFLIGLVVTLVLQSASTVSILTVALGATGLMPLHEAIVIVCGANLGSGLSVALISAHLTGRPRQLAAWQAVVKGLGSVVVLGAALPFSAAGLIDRLTEFLTVPGVIAVTYLLLNLVGAILSGLLFNTLIGIIEDMFPPDSARLQFEPEFIIEEATEDVDTALLLARQEQARLIGLMPQSLSPLREEASDTPAGSPDTKLRALALGLARDIETFISESVERHPHNADVSGLLLLQRCNDHLISLIDAVHDYVDELSVLRGLNPHEQSICESMTEALHFLLGLAADQASGNSSEADTLLRLTRDRSEVMLNRRNEILLHETQSNTNREALFLATGLFERTVWLVRQISKDVVSIENAFKTAAA